MRHHRGSQGSNVGPIRRVLRGVFFLAAAPVFIGVALIMLPFMVIARLLGFRGPKGKFGGHGFGCRGRHRAEDTAGSGVGDASAAA